MRPSSSLGLLLAAVCMLALPGSGSTAMPPPIVIGMIAPLTGTLSAVGSGHRAGAEAAVRELNRQGGVRGRRIVLRLFDDGSNPTQGLIRMEELAADAEVVAMIGSGSGATGLATAPIATRLGLPYISMAPLHTLVYPPRPYVYTTAHTSRLVAYKLAAHLRASGVSRIALLRSNSSVAAEGALVVRELAARYGLEIVAEHVYPLTSTTFLAELVRVKDSDAQALWVWAVDVSAVTITKEFRQLARAAPAAHLQPWRRGAALSSAGLPGLERRDACRSLVARRSQPSRLESLEATGAGNRAAHRQGREHVRIQRLHRRGDARAGNATRPSHSRVDQPQARGDDVRRPRGHPPLQSLQARGSVVPEPRADADPELRAGAAARARPRRVSLHR